MPELTRILHPISQWWQSADLKQRTAALVCGLGCLAAVAFAASLSSRTSYVTLYSGLDDRDASAIVAKLSDAKTPYTISESGAVRVPADRVHELRLQLAGDGLPRGGSVGYELFDQNRLGISEFQEKLNYRRALQGELERTIGRLEPVQQARVHIALPEKQLFASQQEQPSASVILQLRSGSPLGQSEVSAIRHLVSSSVEGLPQQNVTVVDTNGRLLTEGDLSAGAAAGGLTSRLRYEADVEQQVARELQALLDRALGPGRSVVQVSADIDFDQRQLQEETYTPDNDGRGVLETRRENREVYRGSARTGGSPGLSAFRTQPAADPQAAKPPADDYERTESDIRYRVSKRLNTQTTTPGQVRRLSVAIFVDEQVASEHAAAIQKTVAAAAGLDESRGDTIVMQRIPFPQTEPESAPLTVASRLTNWLGASARPVVAVGLLLCFLILARMFLRTNPVVAVTAAPPAQAGKALDVASGAPALPPGEGAPEGGSDIDLDRAASVVRAWLSTGESS